MSAGRDLTASRRQFLQVAGAVAAVQATSAASGVEATPASLPAGYNILFILSDQERYFDRYPFPVPARTELLRTGVSFVNHQITSSVCSPSRSTIYTGLHPQHTGVFDNAGMPWQPDMSPEIRTVGDMLRDVGYHAAYLGKWHLSETLRRNAKLTDAPLARYHQVMKDYGFDDYFGVGDMTGGALGGYRYDGLITESAVTWLRTRALELNQANKPWFLAVNLVNPHDVMYTETDPPGSAPKAPAVLSRQRPPNDAIYRARWNRVALPVSRRQPLDEPGRPAAHATFSASSANLLGGFEFSDARLRIYQDNYYNCIRDCDRRMADLLRVLQEQGQAEKTIVVFSSDHGDYAGAHQLVDKGGTAYWQQNHVPMIVRHPAFPGGVTCNALTSHLDIVPTVLGLTGANSSAIEKVAGRGVNGRDFSGLVRKPKSARIDSVRPAALFGFAMLLYHDGNWMRDVLTAQRNPNIPKDQLLDKMRQYQPNLSFRGVIRSVFDGRYRFSRYFAYNNFHRPRTLEEIYAHNDVELFDLRLDPDEMRNLALDRRTHADLILHLNSTLTDLVDGEVGEDSGASMPIRDGNVVLRVS